MEAIEFGICNMTNWIEHRFNVAPEQVKEECGKLGYVSCLKREATHYVDSLNFERKPNICWLRESNEIEQQANEIIEKFSLELIDGSYFRNTTQRINHNGKLLIANSKYELVRLYKTVDTSKWARLLFYDN